MDAILSDMHSLSATVPGSWLPLLEAIREFDQLYHKVGRNKPFEEHQPLLDLHHRILKLSDVALELDSVTDLPGVTSPRIFVEALLMATRLEISTLFDRPVLDTYGSRTLSHFQVDWCGGDADDQLIRRFAVEVLGLTDADLAQIDEDIDKRLNDARIKARVIDAVCDAFELEESNPDLRLAIKRVTHFLYPDCNLEGNEIDLIVVGTAIFLCIPFKHNELDSARFRRLTLEEQEPIRAFLRKVNRFRPAQFMNFPVFGFLTGKELDADWVADLAEMAQVEPDVVRNELARSVAIIASADVDKFLVHDVWGHVWQSAMLDFEEMYQELGKYADHLTLNEEVQHSYAKGLKLKDCLEKQENGEFIFVEERLRQFIIGEVLERIPVSFSAIVAEMFADVVEYKFRVQNPARAHHMPNSSYFKDYPTKLDLLIEDLDLYFEQATRVFSELETNKHAYNQLFTGLKLAGVEETNAKNLMEKLSEVWKHLSESELKSKYHWEQDESKADSPIRINLYTRLALSFVSLHKSVVAVTEKIQEEQLQTRLFKGFLDQMLLAASLSFEFDRTRMLWHIDEYLESTFVTQLDQYIKFERDHWQTQSAQ